MALTFTDINNGEAGSSVRSKINNFNNAAATQVNTNETNIAQNSTDIATNTTDIATNTGDIAVNAGNITDLQNAQGINSRMKVINNSGVTIIKGKPVRHDGVNSGLPQIVLAKADKFENSRVLGLTMEDIPNGAVGYITDFGPLTGIDTSALTPGIPIYLSDTVAGGLTSVEPKLGTQVGGITVQGSLDGEIFVSLINNISLPTIGAFFQNTATTINIQATPTEFNNFTSSEFFLIDITSGNSFKVPYEGTYTGTFTVSMSGITAATAGHIIDIEVYNKTTTTVLYTYKMLVGRNDTVASASFSAPISLAVNDDISIRYSSATAPGTAVVVDGISLSIESRSINI